MSDTMERFGNVQRWMPDSEVIGGYMVTDSDDKFRYRHYVSDADYTALLAFAEERDNEADLLDFALTNKNESVIELEAKVEEQQKREVEIVSHHNTLVRLQSEQRQRAEAAEAKLAEMGEYHEGYKEESQATLAKFVSELAAMEEVVEAAAQLAKWHIEDIGLRSCCNECNVFGETPSTIDHASHCPVGIVLSFTKR